MTLKLPSHLHRNRHGVFYFRRAVPADLRGYFPTRELYRSLKTASRSEAYRLVRLLSARVEFAFLLLRRFMPAKNNGLVTAKMITEVDLGELGCLRVVREPHDTIEDFNAAFTHAAKALGLSLRGDIPAATQAKPSATLSELIEKYIAEQRRGDFARGVGSRLRGRSEAIHADHRRHADLQAFP
jgi:hypothetical protein